jgi:transcriptional regulator with XRE-family HTH domain
MSTRGRPKGSVNVYEPRDLERMKFLGKKYKRRRLQLKKTQTYIGKAINVSFQQVQKYEQGRNAISTLRIEPYRLVLKIPAHRVGYMVNKYNPKQRNIT